MFLTHVGFTSPQAGWLGKCVQWLVVARSSRACKLKRQGCVQPASIDPQRTHTCTCTKDQLHTSRHNTTPGRTLTCQAPVPWRRLEAQPVTHLISATSPSAFAYSSKPSIMAAAATGGCVCSQLKPLSTAGSCLLSVCALANRACATRVS